MYRNTYVEINLKNIKNNINKIINYCNNYEYFFGVVKADSYGHYGNEVVKSIVDAGANYLCVATLDEALEIRQELDIPVLVLGIVPLKYIYQCIDNNITVTISNLYYVKELLKLDIDFSKLNVHLKINTGMNRLGYNNIDEFIESYNLLINNNIKIEGIFSHIYDFENRDRTNKQIDTYKKFCGLIDINSIKIRHLFASDSMLEYEKPDIVNGCRIGISMYGLHSSNKLELDNTFKLISEVIQINNVSEGTVGYNGVYEIKGNEKIAVVPIGYADGFIRKNRGSKVFINDKEYNIVGNICMDMLFVKVDDNVRTGDKVYLIKDNKHLNYISSYLDTIPYEIICSISKRVPRIYIDK